MGRRHASKKNQNKYEWFTENGKELKALQEQVIQQSATKTESRGTKKQQGRQAAQEDNRNYDKQTGKGQRKLRCINTEDDND